MTNTTSLRIGSPGTALGRANLERLAWKHTHRDYRGTTGTGTKSLLVNTGEGTALQAIDKIYIGKLITLIPMRYRPEGWEILVATYRL